MAHCTVFQGELSSEIDGGETGLGSNTTKTSSMIVGTRIPT